jgi:hypothetical protein
MSRIAATYATEKLQLSNTPGLSLTITITPTHTHTRNVITSIRESPLKFLHGCAPTVLILLRVIFAESGVKSKKYASPHLVYLRRLPRGLRGQSAHAYASIDHVDSRARYCRLDYRRRGDSSVLSAWRRRQISSRGSNCVNRWGDFGFVHLA